MTVYLHDHPCSMYQNEFPFSLGAFWVNRQALKTDQDVSLHFFSLVQGDVCAWRHNLAQPGHKHVLGTGGHEDKRSLMQVFHRSRLYCTAVGSAAKVAGRGQKSTKKGAKILGRFHLPDRT